jgi:hypothetical protein
MPTGKIIFWKRNPQSHHRYIGALADDADETKRHVMFDEAALHRLSGVCRGMRVQFEYDLTKDAARTVSGFNDDDDDNTGDDHD